MPYSEIRALAYPLQEDFALSAAKATTPTVLLDTGKPLRADKHGSDRVS